MVDDTERRASVKKKVVELEQLTHNNPTSMSSAFGGWSVVRLMKIQGELKTFKGLRLRSPM